MPKRKSAPVKGVSPELFELVLKFLRTTYGSQPLTGKLLFELEYHLEQVEKGYAERPKEADPVDEAPAFKTQVRRWSDSHG